MREKERKKRESKCLTGLMELFFNHPSYKTTLITDDCMRFIQLGSSPRLQLHSMAVSDQSIYWPF